MNRPAMHPEKTQLGLWDAVSLILGIVIGAGIYETAPLVFQNSTGPAMALGVWALGGALSLAGAFCYAELASAYPRSGGDYQYLRLAYGPWAGFLFGWCQLAVLMTGSIGMMAYIFADYGATLWKLGPGSHWVLGGGAVLALSLVNAAGVVFGKRAQNVLTGLKVAGLAGIVLSGLLAGTPDPAGAGAEAARSGSIGLALILVLYTYGGWNDAAMITAEVSDTRRNLPRALLLGTLMVTLIYLGVNGAYLLALGFSGAADSNTIAAKVVGRMLGPAGSAVMSVLVMISALGAVNGLIYTGSRVYSSWGEDFRAFSALARWHPRWNAPVISLLAQAVITGGLILLVGTTPGQSLINLLLTAIGAAPVAWSGRGGFETLLRCTAPVFWLFFLMTGLSLFLLRWRDPATPRPFRVPLYPVTPAIFCASCAYMLYSSTTYAGALTFVGLAPVAAGLVVYGFARRSGAARA